MRHILTILIAFHWMAVFALMAVVSTLHPEHGIFAALSLLGAAPTPDATLSGGGPLVAGFFSFAFAVAGILFLWTLATAIFDAGFPYRDHEHVARLAFAGGIAVFSLLLAGAAVFSVPALFATGASVIAALLVSYVCVFAERLAASVFGTPSDADLRAAARLMAAGAAHGALLSRISGRAGGAMAGGAR
jgi:hypothetical protein